MTVVYLDKSFLRPDQFAAAAMVSIFGKAMGYKACAIGEPEFTCTTGNIIENIRVCEYEIPESFDAHVTMRQSDVKADHVLRDLEATCHCQILWEHGLPQISDMTEDGLVPKLDRIDFYDFAYAYGIGFWSACPKAKQIPQVLNLVESYGKLATKAFNDAKAKVFATRKRRKRHPELIRTGSPDTIADAFMTEN